MDNINHDTPRTNSQEAVLLLYQKYTEILQARESSATELQQLASKNIENGHFYNFVLQKGIENNIVLALSRDNNQDLSIILELIVKDSERQQELQALMKNKNLQVHLREQRESTQLQGSLRKVETSKTILEKNMLSLQNDLGQLSVSLQKVESRIPEQEVTSIQDLLKTAKKGGISTDRELTNIANDFFTTPSFLDTLNGFAEQADTSKIESTRNLYLFAQILQHSDVIEYLQLELLEYQKSIDMISEKIIGSSTVTLSELKEMQLQISEIESILQHFQRKELSEIHAFIAENNPLQDGD
ncbi:MAG: hypothetical protein ACI83D_000342 [Planctomycetota bacterium]|jgi:hypothetical protein